MRAITVSEFGGPEVLKLGEVANPELAPGKVLVRTDAIGVNFIDVYFRTGRYPSALAYVPGLEGSGVVVEVGDGVDDLTVGQRVAWASGPGSYAELVSIDAAVAVPVPDGVDAPVAASVLLQGMTAHYLSESVYRPEPGETVLVHAGAGGVGLVLTQMLANRGVHVITTVSSDEKETLSREAGAWNVLRYADDLAEQVRALTSGEGVAATYDGVGASTFDASVAATRVRGMVALFGGASGPVPPFDLIRLSGAGSLFVTRPTLAHYTRDRAELLWRADDVLSAAASGALKIRVGATYDLADAAQAHTDLEARRTTGSIVLIP